MPAVEDRAETARWESEKEMPVSEIERIDVERRGRFTYYCSTRYVDSWLQTECGPFLFAWTARRWAGRQMVRDQAEPPVVASFSTGRVPENWPDASTPPSPDELTQAAHQVMDRFWRTHQEGVTP